MTFIQPLTGEAPGIWRQWGRLPPSNITTPELAQAFIDEQVAAIREQIGDKKVLLALSGRVDSSVVAALLIKAIGKQLICVHVNHGLMRKGESEQVIDVLKNQMDANLVYMDATDRFLGKLVDIAEPVKLLYKDEVRVVGRELGLPENMVERQPFPGPGLGVRCLGAITRDRLEALREADAIVREEIDKAGLTIWQYFAVVPDFRATGVRDGKRAYDWPCIIWWCPSSIGRCSSASRPALPPRSPASAAFATTSRPSPSARWSGNSYAHYREIVLA